MNKITVFNNAILVLENRTVKGHLIVNGNKIEDVFEGDASLSLLESANEVIDCQGKYVSPGFIDMHTHGGGGHDFMDGTADAIIGSCTAHLKHGTTSICPTTLTCPSNELEKLFGIYRDVKKNWTDGPNLMGIHLEGPFFSAQQAGAQDPRFLKLPLSENYMPILDIGGDDIARMSAAVELEGADGLGRELCKRSIVAAIGHSDATYAQVKVAVENGYSLVTHLYSGMSSLHRVGPYRVLGVVESAYLFDELKVEIISDGKHLPPELLRLIIKCKGIDNISLITDSMRGAGMKEGDRPKLGSLENGQETIIEDGVAMMLDHKAFAGSVCTADRAVRTMYKFAGVKLEEAVRMMTLNPARILKADNTKGSLVRGKDADLVIFDDKINISSVYVGGRKLFEQ